MKKDIEITVVFSDGSLWQDIIPYKVEYIIKKRKGEFIQVEKPVGYIDYVLSDNPMKSKVEVLEKFKCWLLRHNPTADIKSVTAESI
jgi:hypothetical protein